MTLPHQPLQSQFSISLYILTSKRIISTCKMFLFFSLLGRFGTDHKLEVVGCIASAQETSMKIGRVMAKSWVVVRNTQTCTEASKPCCILCGIISQNFDFFASLHTLKHQLVFAQTIKFYDNSSLFECKSACLPRLL